MRDVKVRNAYRDFAASCGITEWSAVEADPPRLVSTSLPFVKNLFAPTLQTHENRSYLHHNPVQFSSSSLLNTSFVKVTKKLTT
jgi:hypothetical protein